MPPIINRAEQIGAGFLHGVESFGALSFNNSTYELAVASGSNVYWYQGKRYSTTSAITATISNPVAGTLYYFYFDDASGTLKVGSTAWDLISKVPVATVYWNGTAGAVTDERHGHRRNLRWHINAHLTIGARISPGDFAQTFPAQAAAWVPATHINAGGTLYDEDIATAIALQTASKFRVFYQTGANAWTFVDSDYPYPTNVRFVDSGNSYTLTDVASAQYINAWIFASPDISGRLYCFVETAASAYTTVAQARAATPPNLTSFPGTPELKLLYRVILRGNETFYESTDYRSSASLPAGGVSAPPSAASVSFLPAGSIAAGNVQAAIEEIDSEKSAAGHTHTVTDRIVAVFDGAGAAISANKKIYVSLPFACTITAARIIADQSGSMVVDIWKDSYANYPPTVADTITASAKPTLSSQAKAEDSTLTGWTTAIAAGDVLGFNVDSCATITWAAVILTITRSV